MLKPLAGEPPPPKGLDRTVHPLEWKQHLGPAERALLDELLAAVRRTGETMLDRQITLMLEHALARRSDPGFDYAEALREFRDTLGDAAGFLCDRLVSEVRHALAGGLQIAVVEGDHRLKRALSDTVEPATPK
jgi:hypothetical protein